jgi:hypothetical protein
MWKNRLYFFSCSTMLMGKYTMRTISKESYLEAAQLFQWATKEHFLIWFTGSLGRHRRTEVMLPRLVRKGKLIAHQMGKKIAYASIRHASKQPLFLEHGLGCTEGLVRIIRSKMDGEVIAERFFRGFGSVPEWGIIYPNGKLLLYEYCTQDNFEHTLTMRNKIRKYLENLEAIEEKFNGEAIVLFVIDISRDRVSRFIERYKPIGGQFFFTDYNTFKSVPLGCQLTAPIYFWGEDGNPYPLRSENA